MMIMTFILIGLFFNRKVGGRAEVDKGLLKCTGNDAGDQDANGVFWLIKELLDFLKCQQI